MVYYGDYVGVFVKGVDVDGVVLVDFYFFFWWYGDWFIVVEYW